MFPTTKQIQEFEWICSVINSTGQSLFSRTNKSSFGIEMIVTVFHEENNKVYRFSDPDIEVITKQLKKLLNVFVTN